MTDSLTLERPQTTTTSHQAGKVLLDNAPVRVRACRYGAMAYLQHDTYIGRCLDLYGEFSSGEADLFKQIVQKGMWVMDVGANIGAHSVLFSQLVGAQGRVIAFEPQRVLNQLLCANAAMNGLLNIQPRLAAAGSSTGTLHVPPVNYEVEGNYGCLSLGAWEFGETVPMETIDSLNLPALHMMKIDVEGMEADVLQGAAATIKRCRPIIYLENDRDAKSKQLIELLWSYQYKLFWHLTPYYNPNNHFGNPHNAYEGIVSINMLAVPAETKTVIDGMKEVTSSTETWEQFKGKNDKGE